MTGRGRRIMGMRKVVMAGLALAATVGCAALGRQAFQQPVVTLKDVRLRGLGIAGGNLDVVLSVYNPNDFRLDANRFTYRVLVDTMEIATGEVAGRNTFQSKDSLIVRIPVQFTYAGVGRAAQQLTQTGAVNYRVVGDITVGSIIGDRTIPFSSSGRFSTLNNVVR